MDPWYRITPNDIEDVKGDLGKLPALEIGETIHFDSAKPSDTSLNELKTYLDSKYLYEEINQQEYTYDWVVYRITGHRE